MSLTFTNELGEQENFWRLEKPQCYFPIGDWHVSKLMELLANKRKLDRDTAKLIKLRPLMQASYERQHATALREIEAKIATLMGGKVKFE